MDKPSRDINCVYKNYSSGTKSHGRPIQRWRDNVLKDLQMLEVEDGEEAVLDGAHWRAA